MGIERHQRFCMQFIYCAALLASLCLIGQVLAGSCQDPTKKCTAACKVSRHWQFWVGSETDPKNLRDWDFGLLGDGKTDNTVMPQSWYLSNNFCTASGSGTAAFSASMSVTIYSSCTPECTVPYGNITPASNAKTNVGTDTINAYDICSGG